MVRCSQIRSFRVAVIVVLILFFVGCSEPPQSNEVKVWSDSIKATSDSAMRDMKDFTKTAIELSEASFDLGVICGLRAVKLLEEIEQAKSGTTRMTYDPFVGMSYHEKALLLAYHLRKEVLHEKK